MGYAEPLLDAPEKETLSAFLDYYRALILDKAAGLRNAQLHQTLGPSSLSLGSLVHHLALAEHYWFYETFADGRPIEPWAGRTEGEDWELTVAADLDTNVIFGRYAATTTNKRLPIMAIPPLLGSSTVTARSTFKPMSAVTPVNSQGRHVQRVGEGFGPPVSEAQSSSIWLSSCAVAVLVAAAAPSVSNTNRAMSCLLMQVLRRHLVDIETPAIWLVSVEHTGHSAGTIV
jgi:hypothetical protein